MKNTPAIVSFLLPRLRDILFISVFASVVFLGPTLFNVDGDLGRHITIGKYILNEGIVPAYDLFSHTMHGQKLVAHEWVAQIVFALAYRAMELSGVVYLDALLIAITLLLVYEELVKREIKQLVAFFVTIWVAIVSSVHWLARPHIFTFFFVAIWSYWLEGFVSGRVKSIWRFWLLMLIWANTHGAFISGFVVWGVYLIDWLWGFWQGRGEKEMGKHLALIGLFSFLVTFINPSGWHLWETSIGYISNDFMTSHTREYLSPNFHIRYLWPFMFMVAFGLFSLVQDYRIRVRDGLLLAGWTIMALYSVRNFPLFAVITAPIFGKMTQAWAEKLPVLSKLNLSISNIEKTLRGNLWIYVSVLVFGILLWSGIPLDMNGKGNVYLADKMPVHAVEWLLENPQEGNKFNHFEWGGYILYRMWPQELVFIDGQTDFYGETLFREYVDVISINDGWENVLETYDVKWMLIPRDGILARYLYSINDDTWNVIYKDDLAVIFRRER